MDIKPPVVNQELPPGLSIIHSNHVEDLQKVAVQWIKTHPLEPLENEMFIVQSNGMAQWLKLALAKNDGCGISAALEFQFPARFLWQAYRAVLDADRIPRESPFDKMRLTWRLLRLLPKMPQDGRFAPLKRFLGGDHDLRKSYQLACRLADLFDQYQVYRADWLEDWASGEDQLRNGKGETLLLPKEHAWQAELWRQIRADVPAGQRESSRSALHRRFMEASRNLATRPSGLPRRVIVFGISSLARQVLEALHVLSRHSQVLLFVHNPCRHYWADILEDRELLKIECHRHRRKAHMPENLDPELLHQHANPLLAAWGKQGRDYIGLLYGYDDWKTYQDNFAEIDLFDDVVAVEGQGSLLQQVQQAILDLQPLPSAPDEKGMIEPEDRSIRFHLAHSRQREVEILHDQLLSCFEQLPGLRPRDVIIMTPDIDAYTPHIEAVFGNVRSQDARYIPFTIADRPDSGSRPLLQALEMLFQLPDLRLSVSDLMTLLEVPAFRKRFGLAQADLPRLHQWIEGAGIRWGLNATQRESFDLPGKLEQNTWLFGLRRMLLGYAVGLGDAWREIEPYDEIGGLEAALIGPLAAILEQLEKYWRAFDKPANAEDWHKRILDLTQDCFLPATDQDQLTLNRLENVLDRWLSACRDAGLEEKLTLAVTREAILVEMSESGISQRFLAGRVNFGTLMPMRAIPFKVVCLLGMNDGEYPRSRPPLDFDLMALAGQYRPGDRSRREDDRYLFLEALLSARERLLISYIGRSVHDNSERMPSVLVGQLRDYLAAGWRLSEATSEEGNTHLLNHLTIQHPLQPFSKAYFQPSRNPHLFTYAHEWRNILDWPEMQTDESLLPLPLYEGGLQLNALIQFLKNPVQYFFNQRLNVYFDRINVATEDREPFALESLAPFGPGMQVLEAGLNAKPSEHAESLQNAARRLRRTGELPLEGFGALAATELTDIARSMLKHHQALIEKWPHAIAAMEIRLPVTLKGCDCEVLEDWLDDLHAANAEEAPLPNAADFARWEFYPMTIMDNKANVSRLHSMIGLWVKHLAACARGIGLTSHLIAPDGVARLKPLDKEIAEDTLTTTIEHWWLALEQSLPIAARTALAYANAWLSAGSKESPEEKRQKAQDAARRAYEGDGYHSGGELGYSLYLQRSYPDFDALWQADGSRFAELAETLYLPLVKALKEAQ